jgi:hypothetical protein
MTKDEALKLVQEALVALENISTALREDDVLGSDIELMLNTIAAIHKALAQPPAAQPLQPSYRLVPLVPTDAMQVFVHKQAWINAVNAAPLPVQRTWVGLTDDDLLQIRESVQIVEGQSLLQSLTKAIEAKLKEKNT